MATTEKMQYCFNCGDELGRYRHYHGDLECCGKPECMREHNYAMQAQMAERQERAEADNYDRYGSVY